MQDYEFISNYEKLCIDWQMRLIEKDPTYFKNNFPDLKIDPDSYFITHFGKQYRIDRDTMEITALDEDDIVSIRVKLNIYTYLWYKKADAFLYNDFIPFEKLEGAAPFHQAYKNHVLLPFAQTFSGHKNQLEQACIALSGKKLSIGDVGYEILAFDTIPMRWFFWEHDEEFEAQCNILFDRSATNYIHVESTVTLAIEGALRLIEEAGVEIHGDFFDMQ